MNTVNEESVIVSALVASEPCSWVLVGPPVVVGAFLTIVFAVAMLAVLTQLLAVFLRSVG